MELNKIICRTCLKEEFQQNSFLISRVFPVKHVTNDQSYVPLIQIIKDCFPFMDMTQMINPTPSICWQCYDSLRKYLGVKFKFTQAEKKLTKQSTPICRGCGNPKISHSYLEMSDFHLFYLSLVHGHYNNAFKLLRLCTDCFNLLDGQVPFIRQCFDTADKLNVFIKTFNVQKPFNMLLEVHRYFFKKRIPTEPSWYFNESTNVGSTFSTNSNNVDNSTGVSIINMTEINIINNNNDNNSQNNNDNVENHVPSNTSKETTSKPEEIQAEMPGNLLIKLKKNSGTYHIEKPTGTTENLEKPENPQENIIVIDLTDDLDVPKENPKSPEYISENSNVATSTPSDFPTVPEENTHCKKSEKEKTKSKKRHWTGYYYNCLFGTMKLFDLTFDRKGRPIDADWDKISKAFHIPFEALGITFDVKKGWNRLTKLSLEYLESGRIRSSSHKSLLKKVVEHTKLKLRESVEYINIVSKEVISSEEEPTIELPVNSINNTNIDVEDYYKIIPIEEEPTMELPENNNTNIDVEDYYKIITIDDSSDTDIEAQEEVSNIPIDNKENIKKEKEIHQVSNLEPLKLSPSKRKSLDLENMREQINIEELLNSNEHVGLDDILKLSAQPKKLKSDNETVNYTIESDVIIID